MQPYVIIVDSSADLPEALVAELGLQVVPLSVTVEGEAPVPNDQVNVKEFYAKLRSKRGAKTSAISIDTFNRVFESHLQSGRDVLYLGFSSGLSATYVAGRNAAEELKEENPACKIMTVDTLGASLGQGLLVALTAKKKAEGATIEEAYAFAMDNRLKLCHWFTVDDLFFLKRGGRVSAATAVLGTMLSIKPFMHVDNEGHLINVSKVRGRRASIDAMFDKIGETAIAPEGQLYYICHGDCLEDAQYLADKIKTAYPAAEVMIGYTGTVIGAHSGPGTLALFFLGTER